MSETVKVIARARPINKREIAEGNTLFHHYYTFF